MLTVKQRQHYRCKIMSPTVNELNHIIAISSYLTFRYEEWRDAKTGAGI